MPMNIEQHATFLRNWAKKKVVQNYGGNFWGVDRKHCTILMPETLKALVERNHIEMLHRTQFKVVQTKPVEELK